MIKKTNLRLMTVVILFVLTFCLSSLYGQGEEIIIGTGTSTWKFPLFTYYHDARTQTIYLASELGSPYRITGLALYVTQVPGQTMDSFTIRMKHTDLGVYSAPPVWESLDWTTVYQTNESITTTGWVQFDFITPFEYNGTQNLMVDISFNNGSYTNSGQSRYSIPGGNRTIYCYTDSGYGDPLEWSGVTPSPLVSTRVPNVKLIVEDLNKVATPVFTPSGGFYNSDQDVVISCSTPGATIHYTTNGVDPTENDPIIISGESVLISINPPTTLKARAWKTGSDTSNIKIALYRRSYTGTGTQENPYLIYTSENMQQMAVCPNDWDKDFKLMDDIDLSGAGDNPDGSFSTALIAPDTSIDYEFQGTAFTGVFDGNDHKMINLTIDTKGAGNDYLGLFGKIGINSQIMNLGIEDVNIIGDDYIGGLCGYSYEGAIVNCYSSGLVTGDDYIGGLCGYSRKDIISNCHAPGDVSGDRWVGGLIGCMSGGEVSRCSATGSVTGVSYYLGGLIGKASGGGINECFSRCLLSGDTSIGGLVGTIDCLSIANCYAASSIDSNVASGGLIGDNMDSGIIKHCYAACSGAGNNGYGFIFDNFRGVYEQCFWDMDITEAQHDVYGKGLPTSLMTSMNTYSLNGWSGAVWTIDDGNDYPRLVWENVLGVPIAEPNIPLQGSGSSQDPYQIETEDDYFLVCLGSYFFDKHLMLVANLDLQAILLKWPIGDSSCPFAGRFDGTGHVISNFSWTTPRNTGGGYGFFGKISENGIVQNLRLENVNTEGWHSTGGLAGINYGIIERCSVSGFVDGENYVGGLVGYNLGGSINQCETEVDVYGIYEVGGLIGRVLNGEISQCFSDSSVLAGNGKGGGLIGWNEEGGNIINSYAMSEVVGNNGSVAGLVYWNKGYVANSYSTAKIHGSEHGNTGGLVFRNYGTIEHCFWDVNSS